MPTVHVFAFGPEGVHEQADVSLADIKGLRERWPVVWVDAAGLGDPDLIRRLAESFGVHALAIEDILHVRQRPKLEPYSDHLYLVLRMAEWTGTLETEQISLFLGPGWVLTFQEDRPGDCFGPVRERLRNPERLLRTRGADHLAHALIDSVVDSLFPALEAIGERIEEVESMVLERPDPSAAHDVQAIRRDLLLLRRVAWPAREALAALQRDPSPLISADARLQLRDCHDHAVQIVDLVETLRDVASGLMDVYLSSVSNRMNEVMKVLTIIATVFMPLSFITGLYGMNFDRGASRWNMPELHWRFGYPFALTLMAGTTLGLLYYFWRRGWLGGARRATRGDAG